jgi:hypothetical protein
MGSHEGIFSAEPAAGDYPRGILGRSGEPVVGSPTHPVMPDRIMLWKMSHLRGGGGAGTGLCLLGPPRPLAPPFGTQAGPLSAGLAGGGAPTARAGCR